MVVGRGERAGEERTKKDCVICDDARRGKIFRVGEERGNARANALPIPFKVSPHRHRVIEPSSGEESMP